MSVWNEAKKLLERKLTEAVELDQKDMSQLAYCVKLALKHIPNAAVAKKGWADELLKKLEAGGAATNHVNVNTTPGPDQGKEEPV